MHSSACWRARQVALLADKASPTVGWGNDCCEKDTCAARSGRDCEESHFKLPFTALRQLTSWSDSNAVLSRQRLRLMRSGRMPLAKLAWLIEISKDTGSWTYLAPQKSPSRKRHFRNSNYSFNWAMACSYLGPDPPVAQSSTCTPYIPTSSPDASLKVYKHGSKRLATNSSQRNFCCHAEGLSFKP